MLFHKKEEEKEEMCVDRQNWECFRDIELKKRIYKRYLELEEILNS